MGRFERSERGGGQPDPQEALRRAREALARERAKLDDEPAAPHEDDVDRAREALHEHDEELAQDD